MRFITLSMLYACGKIPEQYFTTTHPSFFNHHNNNYLSFAYGCYWFSCSYKYFSYLLET